MAWIPYLLLFAGLQQPAPPPEPPPDDQGEFRIGVDVNQVYLSVTARSADGGAVRDLTREDFVVLEDGVRQEIVNFTSDAVPVRVALLIDASGSTRPSQTAIRRAAYEFAKSLSEEDRVAVISFGDEPVLILDWTNDLARVEMALETIYSKGYTRLNDALYVTFDDLFRDVPGKKAVILLTDGIDTSSTMTFDEAVTLAVKSEAIVYVASTVGDAWALATALKSTPGWGGGLSYDDIVRSQRALQRLADLTGGRVLDVQAFGSLSDVYAAVADELKNQYYLSYVPSNIIKDGRWRTIEIRSRRNGVVMRTRPGYYAPGAPSTTP